MGAGLPADGAVDVPVNARPMVEIYGDGSGLEFSLESDGVMVEDAVFALVADGDPQVYQLQSPALLAAGADHIVRVVDPDSVEGGGEAWTVGELGFQTGSAEDVDAPEAITGAALLYSELEDEWGGERLYTVNLRGGEDPSGTAWILEFDTDPTFGDPTVRMRLTTPAEVRSGWCTFDSVAEWDPVETMVRATPVDAAGNLGRPVELAPAHEDQGTICLDCDKSGSCSVVSAPVLGFGGLILGLLGVVRRRER
jgi:hypothetical protein